MKFEVYEEKQKQEKTVYLDLVSCDQINKERGPMIIGVPSDDALLVARNNEGRIVSVLVVFRGDGTYARCLNVDPDIGFKLDDKGRIMEKVV